MFELRLFLALYMMWTIFLGLCFLSVLLSGNLKNVPAHPVVQFIDEKMKTFFDKR